MRIDNGLKVLCKKAQELGKDVSKLTSAEIMAILDVGYITAYKFRKYIELYNVTNETCKELVG